MQSVKLFQGVLLAIVLELIDQSKGLYDIVMISY